MGIENLQLGQLVNLAQEKVRSSLVERLDDENSCICSCEICLLDIVAIALNHLPPLYWGNNFEVKRHLAEAHDDSYWQEYDRLVEEALDHAITIVVQNPHH